MELTLVTPEKKVITGLEIDKVVVPGTLGEMEILPNHAPLVSTLHAGVVRYFVNGKPTPVSVSWGYCEVTPSGGVQIMAEAIETLEEIEEARIENSKARAEAKLKEGLTVSEVAKYQRKLQKVRAREQLLTYK